MRRSQYVCRRCGLAIYMWSGRIWKHAAGANQKSCGKPPIVEERATYEQREADFAAAAREILKGPK